MEQSNSERADEIISKLPDSDRLVLEEEREKQYEAASRFAGAAIMARNFSHNKGPNVMPQDLEGGDIEKEKKEAEKARMMALDIVKSMDLGKYDTPEEALRHYPWNFEIGSNVDQQKMAEWNLKLDGRSCLGRVAQAAALVELQFPDSTVGCAEVLSDHLRGDMLAQIKERLPYDKTLRDEWLRELLMYEEPHAVVTVDGEQFDPLSTVYPVTINHPVIQPHPLWEGIASDMKVAEAWLEQDPEKKLQILEEAEKLCPGTTVVPENKVGALILLGKEEEAIALVKELVVKRPNARALYFLWISTGDEQYKKRLDEEYTPYMIDVLKQETGV
jgi:hypothetical protein